MALVKYMPDESV